MRHILLLLLVIVTMAGCQSKEIKELSLAGEWQFRLDSADTGVDNKWFEQELPGSINLPGTLDDAGFGKPTSQEPELKKEVLLGLTRKHDYVGPAWYSREFTVPQDWDGKQVELNLERVIWKTTVWVDGQEVGGGESVVAPHRFDISEYLKPGQKQRLTIRIDNRQQYDISVKLLAHAYTNATQIIWNGVIGDLNLEASDKLSIEKLQVFPDLEQKKLNLSFELHNNTGENFEGDVKAQIFSQKDNANPVEASKSINANVKKQLVSLTVEMDDEEVVAWDEFNPHLYDLHLSIEGGGYNDAVSETFGMRSIKSEGDQMMINGRPLFLRGTLECCIFPLKGYPPMSKKAWKELMTTARGWGLNHLRFHSWCPPEAAFEAADEMGFYLQAELPYWNLNYGEDSATVRFLKEEAQRMIDEYGNHPSFCFWSMGNEIQGDFQQLNDLVQSLKSKDDRHLYCATSFTFEKGHGKAPEPFDDFFITQYTDSGWVRGQGVFNVEYPSFDKDYQATAGHLEVPLITHEIGQYSVYPDPAEAAKYTGNLLPLNFQAIGDDLQKNGMLEMAPDFHKATGAFAGILYKEEIERALKTESVSGFQLLDLHDFPGQGTALVGLLDAFWDPKGAVSKEWFTRFSSPVVPLLRYEKAVYENNEVFKAIPQVVNYSNNDLSEVLTCRVKSSSGEQLFEENVGVKDIPVGNQKLDESFSFDLSTINEAQQLTVELQYGEFVNAWKIWVYPAGKSVDNTDLVVTRSFTEARQALEHGKKVLLNPDVESLKGIEGMFVPVFWSPVHFPDQPGTMGLLMGENHKAFKIFPTSYHSDWQWWDLCKRSKTLELPYDFGGEIIVQVVDNFAKNRLLADVFEARIGDGKLIFCSMDISEDLDERPVARQLRRSLQKYMKSEDFSPKKVIDWENVEKFEL